MITAPKTFNKPCFVFDYQNEYGETYNTLINGKVTAVKGVCLPLYRPGLQRSRFTSQIGKFTDFIEIANKCRGTNIVFEESTIFLKGGLPEVIRDMIVSRFHTQNNLIFVWHKLKVIPPDLMDITNYVILFKTFDTESGINTRFDDELILEAYRRQARKANGAAPTIVDRYNNLIDGKNFEG